MKRRTLLGAAAAAAASAALSACTAPRARTSGASTLAGLGFNLSPSVHDYRERSAWDGLWLNWDWTGALQRQLDLAAGEGASIVRVIGALGAAVDGRLSESDHRVRLAQLARGCADRGLQLYFCVGDLRSVRLDALPDRRILTHVERTMGALGELDGSAMAVDLFNESCAVDDHFGGQVEHARLEDLLLACVAAARSQAGHLAVTLSEYDWSWRSAPLSESAVSKAIDYFDVHLYSSDDLARIGNLGHGQVVIGEVGGETRGAALDELVRRTRAAVDRGRVQVALQWDLVSANFGVFDVEGRRTGRPSLTVR